jgi:tetratricopeptide (TPR) repeat protein
MMLDEALRYGQRAVLERESETYHISLQHLTYEDLRTMPGLGGDWDTLGWTHFKMGHIAPAQKYLEAGWSLFESATIGDHLGQVYEAQGKKEEAARVYARALAQKDFPEETMGRLVALLGSQALADEAVERATESLHQMRSVKVDEVARMNGNAEFFVLFQHGPKVIDVKFIKGSEALRDAGSAVGSAKFEVLFPDNEPTQIVRRGLLTCKSNDAGCEFELMPPDSVQSTQ